MPVDRSNLTGVALVLLAGILWGAMGTSVQYLFSSGAFETPLELVTLRQLCAGSLFVLVMSLVRPRAIWRLWTDRRMVIDAAVSGALLFGAHNAFFESIYYSNAGTGAILLVTVPLWCGLWSAIVNRSPVPRLEIACFLLAAAGVSLIVTDGDFSGLVFSPMAIVWGLVSSIMAAAYNIQSKRLVARAGVVPALAWGLVFGGVWASVFCNPLSISAEWTAASAGAFAFLVLFGTMFAFWSFLAGLRHVSPVVAGCSTAPSRLRAISSRCSFWATCSASGRPRASRLSSPTWRSWPSGRIERMLCQLNFMRWAAIVMRTGWEKACRLL